LLYLPDMRVLGHDPAYFNASALPVAFDPGAARPREWHSFLTSIWPDEPDVISCLQEIFGYLLTADTRQHKIFSIVGPRRSGKGTIARILTALLGKENVVSPSLLSLGQRFGLAPLIGKPLGIMADARLSGRTDTAGVLEALLNISGEDSVTIDRKHREPWIGKLPTRFLLLSNELPRLADNSGVFAGRFVLLRLTRSFYGNEDIGLEKRLRGDLAGVLKWSLEGLRRLQERGRFQLPTSSAEVVRELEDLSSPVGAFVRDRCRVEPGLEVARDDLYSAWCAFCSAQGHKHTTTRETFGRDLRSVVPTIAVRQPREGMRRVRVYVGIGLM
jgi:putative DNA primase/helicase